MIPFLFFSKELEETIIAYCSEKQLQIKKPTGEMDLTQLNLNDLFKTRNNVHIYRNDYLARLKEIVEDLHINGNMKTHGLRKYYMSQLEKCPELSDAFKKTLTGHTVEFRDSAYNNLIKDIDSYYEEWKKIEQLVCVDCIIYDKTNKEVLNLKIEMTKKDDEIKALINENINMEKKMNLLLELVEGMVKEDDTKKQLIQKLKGDSSNVPIQEKKNP